jgi:transketolase
MSRIYLDFSVNKKNPFMRDVFIDEIYNYAKKNKDIYFMTPDMGAPSLDRFRKDLASQFIHAGISEQNMITVASGMSVMNKNVICYAMAPFITSRCYEQIKCSISAMNQKVTLVGIGVGLGYADAGPTHYTTEDIATMRPFPNIEIITPADAYSTKIIASYCAEKPKFRFIRLDRDVLPGIYNKSNFNLTRGFSLLRSGKDKCIISSGYLLHKALKILKKKKNNFALIDLFRIRPFPKEIIKILKKFKEIIVIEEQWVDGGIGSLVLEMLNDNNVNIKVTRIGLDSDYFFENGGRDYLHEKFGLSYKKIEKAIFNYK